jgi:glycosyltransferase involved in cell wall biosynthesis
MKIAIFTPSFLPKCSGAEIFHHNLAMQLAAKGHEPVVIMPRSLLRKLEADNWNLPYHTVPFPANIWSYFKYSASFAFWVSRCVLSSMQRKHGFDVWHSVVLSPAGICFANWQSISGVPGLVRAVGDDVQRVAGVKPDSRMDGLVRRWIPQSQCVVSLSREMSGELCRLGVASQKIEIVSNAVDMNRFALAEEKAALRDDLGIPRDAFLFLCVARNHPQKDLSTLLEAFRLLLAKANAGEVHLAIIGRGVPSLQGVVDSLSLSSQVHLLEVSPGVVPGELPKLPPERLVKFYRVADAFVLSSQLEGFSSALLEAMACGLPIIATSAPGIVDQVEHGMEALLSPCGNTEGLAANMAKVSADFSLRQKLGANSLRRAQNFSWESVALKYAALYTRLVDAAGRQRG